MPTNLPFREPKSNHRYWVDNEDLLTIGEAKKLTAYPMLLAQFLGIAHEIRPEFVEKVGFNRALDLLEAGHPAPALLTSGFLTAGAKRVLATFERRGIAILVVDNVTNRPHTDVLDNIEAQMAQIRERLEQALLVGTNGGPGQDTAVLLGA